MKELNRFPRLVAIAFALLLAACGSSSDTTGPPAGTTVGFLFHAAGSSISAFTQAQTANSSTAIPELNLTFSVGHTLGDVALDRSGNIWAVGVGSNRVFRFPSSTASGVVTADLIISSSELRNPAGIAFDNAGNLYVVNFHSATAGSSYASIVRFNNVQGLSGNQTLVPSLVINPPATGVVANYFGLVHNLAFAPSGDLYVAGPSTIMRFINPQSLTGTIFRTPDGVIIDDGYGLQLGFSGMLAFDASGALWATGCQGLAPCVDFAMKFTNPVYAGVSSPSPNVRLTLGNDRGSNGMAFDAAGDLWMIWDGLGRAIVRIDESSLAANGAVTAATTLNNTSISGIGKLAFFPTPFGLPIY